MTTAVKRAVLTTLAGLAIGWAPVYPAHADTSPAAQSVNAVESGDQVAVADQLKQQAYQALLSGHFDLTNDLLRQAAELSHDPMTERMAEWSREFESQRQVFTGERRKQYDEAVRQVHLLLEKGYEDYAIDVAAKAYLLADDKDAFGHEEWVVNLIDRTIELADGYESSADWLKALRLYSDLGAIQPANPEWKEKLKTATRRIRLLALYAPDSLKAVQEVELKSRQEVDALLDPQKAAENKKNASLDEENDNFRTDWKETLKGIRMEMLWDALVNARTNYFREVSYRDLVIGGLKGMEALATTNGLEVAFPQLADATRRDKFLETIRQGLDEAIDLQSGSEQAMVQRVLSTLRTVNSQTVELPEEVLVSEFADGAFGQLDPFSSIIWPSDVEEFNKTTQGEFSGVGIQIQTDDDGSLRVVSPLEDSPAYRASIKAGDIITHINGKNAKGISLNQAVRTITGPSGTTVMLTMRSEDGSVKEYTIRRETIKVGSIKGWKHLPGGGWNYFVDPENQIGYIRLTNFTKSTSDDLDAAAREMKAQGARAIILDLRYNPGGLLQAATEVSDKFLDAGTIVSTRADRATPEQASKMSAQKTDDEVDLPLVVLVNQYSASASEIVSGALKDQKRATVIGTRTFGKGSVQMLFPLAARSAYLKLTTSHYYLPSGRCIHREENSQEWGVDPDVVVEMTPDQMRAAMEARQEMDVLRDAVSAVPAEGKTEQLRDVVPAVEEAVKEETVTAATTRPAAKDPLASDPQLSAALLLLRLQLAGAEM